MTSTNWNALFTQLIRQERPTYWGNWSLNADISPGAIGVVDTKTGTLTFIGYLDDPPISNKPVSSVWEVSSKEVKQLESEVKVEGTYVDPETGLKITAGVEVTWGFSKESSLVSRFSVRAEKALIDPVETLSARWDSLAKKAHEYGYGANGDIHQGFCVVTNVICADSGLNVGASSKDTTFGMVGTAKGMEGMVEGKGNGSWLYTQQSAGVSCHAWPAESGQVATGLMPIAYTVASFEGKKIIPSWVETVSGLKLHVNNKHGGTYIVHAHLRYVSKSKGSQGDSYTVEDSHNVSGGMETSFTLPLDATHVHLAITFTHNDTEYTFDWEDPLKQWVAGKRHIDVHGVSPHTPSCKEREGT